VNDERRVEVAKGIISSLFSSQRALRALAPEFKWTGLGNLLGDFEEFLAVHEYKLITTRYGGPFTPPVRQCFCQQ